MPVAEFERLTEPAECYSLAQRFLNEGFVEVSRLLHELEGSKWYKVALAIDQGCPEPNWEKCHTVEDAWESILSHASFSPITSAGDVDDPGSGAGSDPVN